MDCFGYDSVSKWAIRMTMAIMVTMAAVAYGQTSGQPTIESVVFYDKYSGEVSLAYEGGYVLITCAIHRGVCSGTMKLVDSSNAEIGSVQCNADGVGILRLNITSSTKFGQYGCEHNNQRSDPNEDFKYRYRTCAKNEVAARECPDANHKFCIVSEGGAPTPCSKPQRDHCNEQHSKSGKSVCTAAVAPFPSLCHAIEANHYWDATVEQNVPCASDNTRPSIAYGTEKNHTARNEPIPAARGNRIYALCPATTSAEDADPSCSLTRSDGVSVSLPNNARQGCSVAERFDLPNEIFDRSDVYKFDCNFAKPPTYQAHLLVYLVTLAGTLTCTKDEVDQVTKKIDCSISPPPPLSEFDVECKFTLPSKQEVKQKELSLDVHESGTYDVQCTITYVSLSPQKPPFTFSTQSVTVSDVKVQTTLPTTVAPPETSPPSLAPGETRASPLPPGETSPTAPTAPTAATTPSVLFSVFGYDITEGTPLTIFIVIVVLIALIAMLIIIGCIVWCCVRSKRKAAKMNARPPALPPPEWIAHLEKPPEWIAHLEKKPDREPRMPRVLAQGQRSLKPTDEALQVINCQHSPNRMNELEFLRKRKALLEIGKKKVPEEQKEFTHDNFTYLARQRDAKAELFKFDDAKGAHSLRLYEIPSTFGVKMLAGPTPRKRDFYSIWDAYKQANVGVVVVIGKHVEPFWAMENGETVKFVSERKPYNAVTRILKTIGENGVLVYKVIVKHSDTGRPSIRIAGFPDKLWEVTVIFVPCDPDARDAMSVAMFNEAIDIAVREQQLQGKRGLPTMAVHSPDNPFWMTFLAVFNAYQGYLYSGNTANPMGFLLFVRKRVGNELLSVESLGVQKLFKMLHLSVEAMGVLMHWQLASEADRKMLSGRDVSAIPKDGRQGRVELLAEFGRPQTRDPPSADHGGQRPSNQTRAGPPVPRSQSREPSHSRSGSKSMSQERSPSSPRPAQSKHREVGKAHGHSAPPPEPGRSQNRQPNQAHGRPPSHSRAR